MGIEQHLVIARKERKGYGLIQRREKENCYFLLISFHTCGAINKMERNAIVPAISQDRNQKKRKPATYPIFTETKVKLIIPAVIKPMMNANLISSFVGFILILIPAHAGVNF
jgi:hypothetical protein